MFQMEEDDVYPASGRDTNIQMEHPVPNQRLSSSGNNREHHESFERLKLNSFNRKSSDVPRSSSNVDSCTRLPFKDTLNEDNGCPEDNPRPNSVTGCSGASTSKRSELGRK